MPAQVLPFHAQPTPLKVPRLVQAAVPPRDPATGILGVEVSILTGLLLLQLVIGG
jgi:hypothetical protein